MRALLEHKLKHNTHSVTRVLTPCTPCHTDSQICSNCCSLFAFLFLLPPRYLSLFLSLARVLSKSISNSFHKAIPVNLHRLCFVSSMRTMWVLRPAPIKQPTPIRAYVLVLVLYATPSRPAASRATQPHWHWWICTQLERKSWRFRPISQNCALKWGRE